MVFYQKADGGIHGRAEAGDNKMCLLNNHCCVCFNAQTLLDQHKSSKCDYTTSNRNWKITIKTLKWRHWLHLKLHTSLLHGRRRLKHAYDGHSTIPWGHGRGFVNGSEETQLMLVGHGEWMYASRLHSCHRHLYKNILFSSRKVITYAK